MTSDLRRHPSSYMTAHHGPTAYAVCGDSDTKISTARDQTVKVGEEALPARLKAGTLAALKVAILASFATQSLTRGQSSRAATYTRSQSQGGPFRGDQYERPAQDQEDKEGDRRNKQNPTVARMSADFGPVVVVGQELLWSPSPSDPVTAVPMYALIVADATGCFSVKAPTAMIAALQPGQVVAMYNISMFVRQTMKAGHFFYGSFLEDKCSWYEEISAADNILAGVLDVASVLSAPVARLDREPCQALDPFEIPGVVDALPPKTKTTSKRYDLTRPLRVFGLTENLPTRSNPNKLRLACDLADDIQRMGVRRCSAPLCLIAWDMEKPPFTLIPEDHILIRGFRIGEYDGTMQIVVDLKSEVTVVFRPPTRQGISTSQGEAARRHYQTTAPCDPQSRLLPPAPPLPPLEDGEDGDDAPPVAAAAVSESGRKRPRSPSPSSDDE
jgi:hypothetical protein